MFLIYRIWIRASASCMCNAGRVHNCSVGAKVRLRFTSACEERVGELPRSLQQVLNTSTFPRSRARNNVVLGRNVPQRARANSFPLTPVLCSHPGVSGHQSGFCMICVMQNHIIQAYANTGNAIKPVSFIRDLKSKAPCCDVLLLLV